MPLHQNDTVLTCGQKIAIKHACFTRVTPDIANPAPVHHFRKHPRATLELGEDVLPAQERWFDPLENDFGHVISTCQGES